MRPSLALVIGGFVNGYSIIQELYDEGVTDIGLLYYKYQPAKYSNKTIFNYKISRSNDDLLKALKRLESKYERIVIFPCDEGQIEQLNELAELLGDSFFLPFNPQTILDSMNKEYQYKICVENKIPYPKTQVFSAVDQDLERFKLLKYPVIIKPRKRYNIEGILRIIRVNSYHSFIKCVNETLTRFTARGAEFLVSELIPGDTKKGLIYAYTCYRSPRNGKILNEWVGRKESQFPNDYGIFATASSFDNETVLSQGRALVMALDAYGIVEPEFKYDERDCKYKLMEVNYRSMMWHRTGNLAGVKLQYTQWRDALGLDISHYRQKQTNRKFTYLLHEIYNLFRYNSYFKYFVKNVMQKSSNLALWDKSDPWPFMFDLIKLIRIVPRAIIDRLRNAQDI